MSATWTHEARTTGPGRWPPSCGRRLAAATLTGVTATGDQRRAAEESTLTVPADTQMTTFNPFLGYYDGELNIIGAIYPALTALDEKGEPSPYLAESWTTSDDKLTWTFKLKPGLKWTDGEPLTAKDAAWTFNLIMPTTSRRRRTARWSANFKSVTAPDDTRW